MWIIWTAAGLCLIAAAVAALWKGLRVRYYTVRSEKLTAPLRAVLITDLHSSLYGEEQARLVERIRREKPDLLLFAGDIADNKVPHKGCLELLAGIRGLCPGFYCAGNHEFRTGALAEVKNIFRAQGITVLDGKTVSVEIGGQRLFLGGVDDPECFGVKRHEKYTPPGQWLAQLEACKAPLPRDSFSILLSHRPELADEYEKSGFDLVLAGHAHGGQVRIPGVLNGLFAPSQGLFPKYAGGEYRLGKTRLIVSRGLCRNFLPRVFNPPELVVIRLVPASP